MADVPELPDPVAVRTPNENKICPSKSTVYLGNISYSLTNNDIIKLLEHCGTIVSSKVTKDRETRKSKGYAFVQFLKPEAAMKCVEEFHNAEVFGRKWTCSIAKDNGRTSEFIRKRIYPDKSRCWECGECDHLSYECPHNSLGARQPPPKKKKKRNTGGFNPGHSWKSLQEKEDDQGSSSPDSDQEKGEIDSLSAAINDDRQRAEEEEYKDVVASGSYTAFQDKHIDSQRKRFVKGYFSDEEELDD